MNQVLLTILVVTTLSCATGAEPQPMPEVEFLCDAMLELADGPACELTPGDASTVRVWVRGGPPRARIDERPVEPQSIRALDGGHLLTIAVPDGARELALTRDLGIPERWHLAFAWRPTADDDAALNLAFSRSRWRDCQLLADAAFPAAVAARRSLAALQIAHNGLLCSTRMADPAGVWSWYARARRLPAGPDFRGLIQDRIEADALLELGALHSVGAPLERALQRSHRLQTTSIHAEVLSLQSLALAELGDFDAAITAARATLDRTVHPYNDVCSEAELRINLAWTLLLAAGRTHTHLTAWTEAEDELLQALGTLEEPSHDCSPESLQIARLNLVHVGLLRGAPLTAALWLAELEAALGETASPAVLGEMHVLAARIALALADRSAAAEAVARAEAYTNLPADLRLDMIASQAELAEMDGDLKRAQALYQGAHRRTLGRIGRIGHDQSAHRFLFDRLRASGRLARSFIMTGATVDAFWVAREAASAESRLLAQRITLSRSRPESQAERHRYLESRSSQERLLVDRWDLPDARREALGADSRAAAALFEPRLLGDGIQFDLGALPFREPEPAELQLLYLPMADEQLLGFARTVSGVTVAPIDTAGLPPRNSTLDARGLAAWSERLLSPFDEVLGEARRIQILPSFGLQTLPFHALPWQGEPLLVHAAVEYSLDLPPTGETRPSTPPDRVLVIGDPHGDLRHARQEAEHVAADLRARKMAVEELVGRQADGPGVRARLPQVGHLHYAGHSESAGSFGWQGSARLSHRSYLSIPDILSLDRVPDTVTLLSCDSGIVRSDPRQQSIALATAFLLAGSQAVMASTHRISEDDAPKIAEALYARSGADALDLRSAYRTALLGPLASQLAPGTWQSLRLWTP